MTVKDTRTNFSTLRQHKYPLIESERNSRGTLIGMQKTITLNRIKSLVAIETDYDNLRDTIINAIRRETQ